MQMMIQTVVDVEIVESLSCTFRGFSFICWQQDLSISVQNIGTIMNTKQTCRDNLHSPPKTLKFQSFVFCYAMVLLKFC